MKSYKVIVDDDDVEANNRVRRQPVPGVSDEKPSRKHRPKD